MQIVELETKTIVMGIITGKVCGTVLILGLVVLFGWYFYLLHERQETIYYVEDGGVAPRMWENPTNACPTTHPNDSAKTQA